MDEEKEDLRVVGVAEDDTEMDDSMCKPQREEPKATVSLP